MVAARETASECQASDVPLIIDDDITLLLATEAAGVHLGSTDLPVAVARSILGSRYLIGGTATTVEQALKAESDGADYIGFGPVYRTHSKSNPASVKGIAGLKIVCNDVSIPVIAITAFAMKGDEEKIRDGGCEAYIAKPISVANFLQTIEEVLN